MAAQPQPEPRRAGDDRPYPVFTGDNPSSRRTAPRAPRSVELPVPVTDLSKLLARDATLCVQRPGPQSAVDPQPVDEGDLAHMVHAWPELPENVRAAVVAFVDRR